MQTQDQQEHARVSRAGHGPAAAALDTDTDDIIRRQTAAMVLAGAVHILADSPHKIDADLAHLLRGLVQDLILGPSVRQVAR